MIGIGALRLANPMFLLFLLILPLLSYYLFRGDKKRLAALKFSSIKNAKKVQSSFMVKFRPVLHILRLFTIALVIIALARPQWANKETLRNLNTEGIDIVLALDVSESMRASDFEPNRLEASKKVVAEFIDNRQSDKIGTVVFAAASFPLCPLTLDYGVVKDFIKRIDFGVINGNATAIGMGLATSIKMIKDAKAKSKIIVLLTDGQNNIGKIDPMTAAELAKTLKIKVYTIGVGSRGVFPMKVDTPLGPQYVMQKADIDERTLTRIAELTGGKYYRAANQDELKKIYDEINKLEKSRIEVKEHEYYDELMHYLIIPALLLLLLEILLANTRFMKLP